MRVVRAYSRCLGEWICEERREKLLAKYRSPRFLR